MIENDKYKIYDTPQAFRQALEARLSNITLKGNVPLDRLRKWIVFDRLLARLFTKESDEKPFWYLKGGYALEIRFSHIARATKDIDISIPLMKEPSPEAIHEMLIACAAKDIGDWFTFLIGTFTQDLHQPVYGGWRYPVEARLAAREFTKFHIDVAVGDAVIEQPEWIKGPETLSFAGIEPPLVALYPKTQHFAEKIHSFTFPREKRDMSRVRDLVDLVLLVESALPAREEVVKAIQATFDRRKTHEIPKNLEPPPDSWREPYRELATECGVKCKTMEEAFELINEYWKNIYLKG